VDRVVAHATLGVSADATPEDIRAAYRRRAFETHPDRSAGSTAEFQAVAEAYRVLTDPGGDAQGTGQASGPGASSRVPSSDAAKVLFEYLSDLASEMILNGAAPDAIVSFLAREGCPESVARALERDLRTRVGPAASEASRTPPSPEHADHQHTVVGGEDAPGAPAPCPIQPGVTPFARWMLLALAPAAAVTFALVAWRGTSTVSASEPPREIAPPPAAPAPPIPAAQPAAPEAPSQASQAPAPPARSSSAPRVRSTQGQRQQQKKQLARVDAGKSLGAMSAELDAERNTLEADRRRLAAEAEELRLEKQRIELAALTAGADPAAAASLRRRESAYGARLGAARRTEAALEHRTRDLNARIAAYNDRVRAARQR
jgi:hypothetical protein